MKDPTHEPPCEHEWSAIRRVHTCLKGCGAEMSATTGAVTQATQPPGADATDAARYRWLRKLIAPSILARIYSRPVEQIQDQRPEALDAVIDYRLSETKGGEQL